MPNTTQEVDPLLEAWGQTIRYLRLSLNAAGDKAGPDDESMTQEQLGAEMDPNVDQSTVARWESGQREPRRRFKKQLADLFGLPQEMIFVSTVDRALPLGDPRQRTAS